MSTALTVATFASNEQTQKLAEYFSLGDENFKPWVKSALIAISTTPSLQECLNTTDGQKSIFEALRFAASTGLSLNPQEGKAALIAYKGKAQYQIMKNGMTELLMRNGAVKSISCDTVRENDIFEIEKAANGDTYSFRPARKSRGEIDGFFAAVVLKDGTCNVKYMTVEEVKTHRAAYSQGFQYAEKNGKKDHVWIKSFEGMATKTVIKALLRNLSISPEISRAIGIDDQQEAGPTEPKDITPKEEKGVGVAGLLTTLKGEEKEEQEVEVKKEGETYNL